MIMASGGIVMLMALNLAVNTAVALMILLHCPISSGRSKSDDLSVCGTRQISNQRRKEEQRMNRIWADALVAVLVAATQTILELIKRIKKKGKAVS